MKHSLLIAALMALSSAPSHAVAPIHDNAAKPLMLSSSYQVTSNQNLALATAATTDPLIAGQPVGRTLWYRIPANLVTPNGWFYTRNTIRCTAGAVTLAAYTMLDEDNSVTSLEPLGAPVAIVAGQSHLANYTIYGHSVVLMVSGAGVFDLTHRKDLAFNDFPVSAEAINNSPATVNSNNRLATVSPDEPSFGAVNTVWYKWTTNFSGSAAVDTNFSCLKGEPEALLPSGGDNPNAHNTVIAVYQGTPDNLTLVGTDDDTGWGRCSRVMFTAVSGQAYYIAVGTHPGQQSGGFTLNCYQASTAGELYFADYPAWNNSLQVSERNPKQTFTIRRRYTANVGTVVTLSTVTGGSATSGSDFQALNTQLTFQLPGLYGDDAWEQTADLTITNDSTEEGSEWVKLQLSAPGFGASLRPYGDAGSVIIMDDDLLVSSSADLFLQHDVIRVSENYGELINVVFRGAGAGNVGYPLVQTPLQINQTAMEGTDFHLIDGNLGASESSAKVEVWLYNDNVFEDTERVQIRLSPGLYYDLIIEDDDPFVPVAGRLMAALGYSSGGRQAQLYATVSALGIVTGKLVLPGLSLPFSTKLDWHGKALILLTPPGRASLLLTLQATNENGGYRISLLDKATNKSDEEKTTLSNYAPLVNQCPEAGRYTFTGGSVGGGGIDSVTAGSIVVDASGNAVVAGRLFDGRAYTTAGYVDGSGLLSALAQPVGGGSIGFSSILPALSGQFASITLKINRPARTGVVNQTQAIVGDTYANVSRYSPPAIGQQALECWSGGAGKVQMNGGPLMSTLNKTFTITTNNLITVPLDAEKLKLTLVPSTGLFTGSFVLPGTTRVLPLYGALLDLPGVNGSGRGFFYDGLKAGSIYIGKP